MAFKSYDGELQFAEGSNLEEELCVKVGLSVEIFQRRAAVCRESVTATLWTTCGTAGRGCSVFAFMDRHWRTSKKSNLAILVPDMDMAKMTYSCFYRIEKNGDLRD